MRRTDLYSRSYRPYCYLPPPLPAARMPCRAHALYITSTRFILFISASGLIACPVTLLRCGRFPHCTPHRWAGTFHAKIAGIYLPAFAAAFLLTALRCYPRLPPRTTIPGHCLPCYHLHLFSCPHPTYCTTTPAAHPHPLALPHTTCSYHGILVHEDATSHASPHPYHSPPPPACLSCLSHTCAKPFHWHMSSYHTAFATIAPCLHHCYPYHTHTWTETATLAD